MTSGSPKTLPYRVLEPPPPLPLVTIAAIFLPVFVGCVSDHSNINWVEKMAFTATKMSDAMGNPATLSQLMFQATFAQLSVYIWILNGIFIWAFGHVVEKQLKWMRYAAFMLAVIVSGWVLTFVVAGTVGASKMYIGPSLMIFGLLGAYFVFLPKRPFKPQDWVKANTQIFRNEKETPLHERYWVSPWLYIIAFVAYEVILQLALYLGRDGVVDRTHIDLLGFIHVQALGRMNPDAIPYAFHPVAAIANIAVGVFLSAVLPKMAVALRPKRPGGKLQLEVLQHYKELRTLDMTHEQACEGAAKFASVPIDTAKDWIAKGAAGLKDQDLR